MKNQKTLDINEWMLDPTSPATFIVEKKPLSHQNKNKKQSMLVFFLKKIFSKG